MQKHLAIVKSLLTKEDLAPHKLTHTQVVGMIKQEIQGFGIDLPFEEVLKQELPYIKQHGMTAFNCGYVGLKLI